MPTPEEMGMVWMAGDMLTITNQYIIAAAGAYSTKNIFFSIPLGKPVTASGVKVSVMEGNIRQGGNIIKEAGSLLKGATPILTLIKPMGLLTIQLQHDAGLSDITSNSPVAVAINKLEIEFI